MQNFHFHTPSTKFPHFPIINLRHNANRQQNENVKIHHPRSEFITKWNNIFLIVCLISLFLDPLFFYVPTLCGEACVDTDVDLLFFIMWLRTIFDSFYAAHIYIKFKTAFVNPSSRVFGRGEIVVDPKAIAIRYLKRDFVIDFSAMLPLPQILLWFVYPSNKDHSSLDTNYLVAAVILIQYIPRLCVMLPLNKKIADTTGIVAKNAFSGAIYNLVLFTLAGHVVGAIWYLWALDHITNCWEVECNKEAENDEFPCFDWYFYKKNQDNPDRQAWAEHTGLFEYCSADTDNPKAEYKFGIFGDAVESDIFAVHFWGTYFYCLWWGLQNLGYHLLLVLAFMHGTLAFSITNVMSASKPCRSFYKSCLH